MSDKNKQDASGGSDEAFMAVLFAITSMIALVVYIPVVTWGIKSMYRWVINLFAEKPKRRRYDDSDDKPSQIKEFFDAVLAIPRGVLFGIRNPPTFIAGASLLWCHKSLAWKVAIPRGLKFVFRPKVIVLVVWLYLLSYNMYNTLTYDPYKDLGLMPDATTSQVKKAYRQLSKINHPDQNKTEAAKIIYPKIRRAYKALVDKKAYEEDTGEEFSVGIALPVWLVSHDNDGLKLLLLLGILFAVPFALWYYLSGSRGEQIESLLTKIKVLERQLELIYESLGIPQDPKFVDKRRQREELFQILTKQQIFPPGIRETVLDKFPSLHEFRTRCLDPERYGTSLHQLGFDDTAISRLKDFFESYPEVERQSKEQQPFRRGSKASFTSAMFFIKQVNAQTAKTVDQLQEVLTATVGQEKPIELPTSLRLARHRAEVVETLERVWRDERYVQRDVQTLIEAPRRREELVGELMKDIDTMFRHLQKYYQAEQRRMMAQQAGQGRR